MVESPAPAIVDEHSVLLWQTCAFADELMAAARSGRRLAPAFDAMLEFLHYRLLPYLTEEEHRLPAGELRDEHLAQLLAADHARLRTDVETLESSRTRRVLGLAAGALVDRLDRHVRREESWVSDPWAGRGPDDSGEWALPLLLGDEVDVDALPPDGRDGLVIQRLQWMRPGDTVRLRAGHDLHSLWRLHHGSHVWVYERSGPRQWQVRVTRRDPNDI